MILIIAIGVSALIVLPIAATACAVWALHTLRQGRRLGRSRTTPAVVAIDSRGRPYEAVPVEPCEPCGQALPADHQCSGQAVTS